MRCVPSLYRSQAVALAFGVFALASSRSAVAQVYLDVVISEIMYHASGSDEEGEYIELTNRGSQTVDLTGWRFSDGIDYAFPAGTMMAPGSRLVIAKDPVAASVLYGISITHGPYEGRLENAGERIEIRNAADGLVHEVDYDDEVPWPTGGDGDGRSIELTNLFSNGNVGRFWLPSSRILGSPGAANSPGLPPATVVINEFVANSSTDDWVELYNYGNASVNINGFYLTDNPRTPTKAQISASWSAGTTVIPAKGRWVATQSDFGFGLSADGEQLHLVAADGITWVDGYDFGDQPIEDASEGRYPDGGGDWYKFVTPTMGSANQLPPNPGIVINEIMYHPLGDSAADPGAEYIELRNLNGFTVDLSDWKITQGVDFTFPLGTAIPANGFVVIAANPALVQSTYGIGGVLGPYTGRLSNFSDELEIEDHLDNRVDKVEYRQEGLWPEPPDGTGPSLELATLTVDNSLPGAWRASTGTGTPGAPNSQSVANPAASIDRVRHAPLVPTSSEQVIVTARIGAGSLTSTTLFYKRDQDGGFSSTGMFDDGLHGDELAGDGIYGGTIPVFAHGTIVEFYIQANATGGNRTFPDSAAANKSCLYIVQNSPPTSNLTIFRIVITAENSAGALNPSNCSNFPAVDTRYDCTFIYGDKAYYNSQIRRRSGARCGPKYSYKIFMPPGYHFRGADRFDLNFEKGDETALRNKIVNHLLEYMGLPYSRTEFVHTRYQNNYAGVHIYTEARNSDFLDRNFPDDSDGNMYKATSPFTTPTAWNEPHARYEKETNEVLNDWSDLDELGDITTSEPAGTYESEVRRVTDVVNWGRSFAVWGVTCLIDSPWHIHNQNYRLYRRFSDDRFVHILYDFDDTYWDTAWNGFGLFSSLYPDVNRWYNTEGLVREYVHGVARAVNLTDGVYRESRIMPEVYYYHDLIYDDVDADPVTGTGSKWTEFMNGISQWQTRLGGRNALLRAELPTDPLAITTNGGNPFSTPTANVVLQGTAPITAPRLEVHGNESGILWQEGSVTQWQKTITLVNVENTVVVRTLTDDGTEIARVTIDITYTNGIPNNVDFSTGTLPTQPPYAVQFFDESSASGITAWNWDFGDGQFSTQQNPLHTYANWGDYDVMLTITAPGGPFAITKPITVGTPITADFDHDGDRDLSDYGFIQACLSGPGIEQTDPNCQEAKLDPDGDVDPDDVEIFLGCMTDSGAPAAPTCP